jgi:hypothetical protein
MKRFPLLPLVALVFAAAYACTDSTAPANAPTLLARSASGVLGDPPPPPVDAAIAVSIQSPEFAVFTGVYFSNGNGVPDDGTAWLRLDNNKKQPDLGGTASANTRFMVKDANPPTGMGTLFIAGHSFKIISVQGFTHFGDCGAPKPDFSPSACASIDFRATDENGVEHTGQAQVFDKASCLVPDNEGGFIFVCGGE